MPNGRRAGQADPPDPLFRPGEMISVTMPPDVTIQRLASDEPPEIVKIQTRRVAMQSHVGLIELAQLRLVEGGNRRRVSGAYERRPVIGMASTITSCFLETLEHLHSLVI